MSTLLSEKVINGECRSAWDTGLQLNLHGFLIISSTTVNSMFGRHLSNNQLEGKRLAASSPQSASMKSP